METLKEKRLRLTVYYQHRKKHTPTPQRGKQLRSELRKQNNKIMAALEKEPITKLEKWINRIVTIAIAVYEIIQHIITTWKA